MNRCSFGGGRGHHMVESSCLFLSHLLGAGGASYRYDFFCGRQIPHIQTTIADERSKKKRVWNKTKWNKIYTIIIIIMTIHIIIIALSECIHELFSRNEKKRNERKWEKKNLSSWLHAIQYTIYKYTYVCVYGCWARALIDMKMPLLLWLLFYSIL